MVLNSQPAGATTLIDIYGGKDPRHIPAYGIAEASRYLSIPRGTLRGWTLGQPYEVRGVQRLFAPVIQIADRERRLLSFTNLFEGYVLDAIRRQHSISLQKVRRALAFLRKRHPGSKHPLAEYHFATFGADLFIEEYGRLVGVSSEGQLALRQAIDAYLNRVDRDETGLLRLYPFTRRPRSLEGPRVVVIDPRISFGRPVITGTRIATAVIAERWRAGESVEALAADYGRSLAEIEEAIRCETTQAA
jgi:uncharacterized protein (DUF433 family)